MVIFSTATTVTTPICTALSTTGVDDEYRTTIRHQARRRRPGSIRTLLQHQAEKSRQWQDDEGVVEIDEEYVDDVIKRLDQNIRALCNAAEPDQHSTSVRSHALIVEKAMNPGPNIVRIESIFVAAEQAATSGAQISGVGNIGAIHQQHTAHQFRRSHIRAGKRATPPDKRWRAGSGSAVRGINHVRKCFRLQAFFGWLPVFLGATGGRKYESTRPTH